jgi:hypothetical protein
MDVAEVHELIDVVAARGTPGHSWTAAAAAVGQLRAWLDGREVDIAAELSEISSFPEQVLADAEHASLRDAVRVLSRCQTVGALPALGEAVAAGTVSGSHVDVVSHALRRLEPAQRPQLAERDGWLADLAARTTPDELQRVVAEVRRITRADGLSRLDRQRRAVRVRSWVDPDGMWCFKGRFDPETGVTLQQHLDAALTRRAAARRRPQRSDRAAGLPARSRAGRNDHRGP